MYIRIIAKNKNMYSNYCDKIFPYLNFHISNLDELTDLLGNIFENDDSIVGIEKFDTIFKEYKKDLFEDDYDHILTNAFDVYTIYEYVISNKLSDNDVCVLGQNTHNIDITKYNSVKFSNKYTFSFNDYDNYFTSLTIAKLSGYNNFTTYIHIGRSEYKKYLKKLYEVLKVEL